MPTFKKGEHTVATEVPAHIVQLQASGYRKVDNPQPAPTPAAPAVEGRSADPKPAGKPRPNAQ